MHVTKILLTFKPFRPGLCGPRLQSNRSRSVGSVSHENVGIRPVSHSC